LISLDEDLKKSKNSLINQIDSLKISSNLESQRMKSQIYEMEKITEKIHKSNL
jgi:hypothetical protein